MIPSFHRSPRRPRREQNTRDCKQHKSRIHSAVVHGSLVVMRHQPQHAAMLALLHVFRSFKVVSGWNNAVHGHKLVR